MRFPVRTGKLLGAVTLAAGALAGFGAFGGGPVAASPVLREAVPPAQPAAATSTPILFDGQYYGWAFLNWSGYAVTTGPYTSVTGDWIVPTVTTKHGPGYSAAWTGIDGFDNTSLIQVGTEQDAFHGGATDQAWWASSDQGYFERTTWARLVCVNTTKCSPTPTVFTVNAGDKMVASIQETTTTVWDITLLDTTTGVEGIEATIPYTASMGATGGDSAEWVMERPSLVAPGGGSHLGKLANFGTITFDTATVNTGGAPGFVATATVSDAGVMVQGAAKVIAIPSGPDGAGDGFNVSYGAQAPTPPPTS